MTNEEKINSIKNQIRELFRMITSIGEEPPEAVQDLLLLVLEKFAKQIQELRSQSTESVGEINKLKDNIAPAGPSSNIEGFAYDDKNKKLLVRFLGEHPNRNGPIYAYQGVPPEIFNLFRRGAAAARTDGQNKWGKWWKGKSPSMGASMYTLIKMAGFPYQKVG